MDQRLARCAAFAAVLLFALTACGGGGGAAPATSSGSGNNNTATVTGVTTPSGVSVVTATHETN